MRAALCGISRKEQPQKTAENCDFCDSFDFVDLHVTAVIDFHRCPPF
jgi:hypothetical protein